MKQTMTPAVNPTISRDRVSVPIRIAEKRGGGRERRKRQKRRRRGGGERKEGDGMSERWGDGDFLNGS